MSKNLIIDYLSRIEVQMNSLKDLVGKLDMNHELNIGKIRLHKAQMTSSLNNDVVNISSSKYIRDENRIIISAPEIVIGNVDKDGNLIASNGTSRVVIRANQVGLEGVSKDDSTIGVVTTRAPRIHQVAVDPGIDGRENYVGQTSEILSLAKGIEVRSDQNNYCISRSMSESVPNGIHLLSPTDINITSTSSCAERKNRFNIRKKEIDDNIVLLSKQLNDTDLSIKAMMNKITEHSNNPAYADVSPYTVCLSYTEIDAANRILESYLIALLKQVNKFFQIYSQLVELLREKHVIESQLNELESMDLPPVSKVQINAPLISMRTVDGDGNFRTDGSVFLHTQAFHAYGKDAGSDQLALDTKMKVKFNHVTIDTSQDSFDTASNKHVYKADGSFNLYSQKVIVEGVNYEQAKGSINQENKEVSDGSNISLKVNKLDFSSLNKKGENTGEVKINAKKVDVLSHDVTSDGKFKATEDSCCTLFSQALNIGEVKLEPDNITYSKNIRMSGEEIRFRSTGFFANTYEKLENEKNIGYIQLLPNKPLKMASNEGITMSVSGNDKIVVESDDVTLWPELVAKISIEAPSVTVDNLKVNKSFSSPCTKEGTAINAPAPQAPAASSDEPKDNISSTVIEPEDPELRKKAEEATEKCNQKVREWNEKKKCAKNKKKQKTKLETEKADIEKNITDKTTNYNLYTNRLNAAKDTYNAKAQQHQDDSRLKTKSKAEVEKEKREKTAAMNSIMEFDRLAKEVSKEINELQTQLKKKNEDIQAVETELKRALDDRHQAHSKVKQASKKEKDAWQKVPGATIPKRDGKTYELVL